MDARLAESPPSPQIRVGEVEDGAHQLVVAAQQRPRDQTQISYSITKIIGAICAIALSLWLAYGYQYEKPIDPLDFKSRTDRVLATTPLIDGHNDLPYLLRIELKNKIYDVSEFTFGTCKYSHVIPYSVTIESLISSHS